MFLRSVDYIVRKSEAVAWAVLTTFVLMFPWFGVESPISSISGEGMRAMDFVLTALLVAATAGQITRIFHAPSNESGLVRSASWLLLLSLCLFTSRFVWVLVTAGDIQITMTSAIAIILLCLSVLLHAAGRVIYKH